MTGVAAEVGSTANHYQILARLAVGGMAEIFLARGTSTTGVERYCVLKRILRERATDVHFVRMFLDEARLAAQLQHPNVAQVLDLGKLGDSYFFTMEYVHGETIRAILHRARSLRRELPPAVVLTVIAGAAAGLHHAHERLGHDGRPLGIVHRDVSPSNLMVSFEGGVKVVDFGVAKAENRAQETRSGTVKGKIAYLSPEQCRGTRIDRRSDLFSLGIVMWEMLTTDRLYKRASDFDNMTAIVNEEPVAPSTRRTTVAPELDAIALRLLAKDPDARFQTADELVDALEQVAARTGTMISAGALGRFLRELFGQRPEPWLELDQTTDVVEAGGVTVTSEPIPQELAIAAAASMDLKLSGVPDLSEPSGSTGSGGISGDAVISPSSLLVTAPGHRDPQQVVRSLPLAPPPVSDVVARPAELRAGPPSTAPAAHPASSSGAFPSPGASGSQGAYPVLRRAPQPARNWPLIAIIAAAAVIGSVTVWIVMRGSHQVSAVRDAAVVESPASDAAASRIRVEPIAPDAPPIDAADPPAATAAPDELAIAMADHRYDDAVASCAAKLDPQRAALCTLAACHVHQDVKARAWYGRVATGRRAVVTACHALGVELVPKPKPVKPVDAGVVDRCALDPMACQN